jgi:hypothetical protein
LSSCVYIGGLEERERERELVCHVDEGNGRLVKHGLPLSLLVGLGPEERSLQAAARVLQNQRGGRVSGMVYKLGGIVSVVLKGSSNHWINPR